MFWGSSRTKPPGVLGCVGIVPFYVLFGTTTGFGTVWIEWDSPIFRWMLPCQCNFGEDGESFCAEIGDPPFSNLDLSKMNFYGLYHCKSPSNYLSFGRIFLLLFPTTLSKTKQILTACVKTQALYGEFLRTFPNFLTSQFSRMNCPVVEVIRGEG